MNSMLMACNCFQANLLLLATRHYHHRRRSGHHARHPEQERNHLGKRAFCPIDGKAVLLSRPLLIDLAFLYALLIRPSYTRYECSSSKLSCSTLTYTHHIYRVLPEQGFDKIT